MAGFDKKERAKKEAKVCLGTPRQDGYHMPGEYEHHQGCIMIWPERPGSWIYGAKGARRAFRDVIAAIAESEKVYVAVSAKGLASAQEMLLGTDTAEKKAWQKNVEIFPAETDDAWARDVAPTFVVQNAGAASKFPERIRAINWEFNAWGGKVDGLYASWEKDNAFAAYFAEKYGFGIYDAAPFVLEGGSIHSDGEGTVMVTEACLLSKGRNPDLNRSEIEERLREYLGAEKILWLPRGIYQDETNEHVDNVCAFIRPGEVVLAWTDNQEDPQYALSQASLSYLENETDARGRKIKIHKLPVPDVPICITEEELAGYAFEEGEDAREAGERLAASYVNFYFSNKAVVMPVFGGENTASDERAIRILAELCPERKVIPVAAKDILAGGGNIHCITQQIPD
jgi:agmatine deiminase